MIKRKSQAKWNGNLIEGSGNIKLGSEAYEGQYSFSSRFESGTGTNPEELIAAAHAGCFSMAFANILDKAGYTPNSISSEAEVQLEQVDGNFVITQITLRSEADVPNIDNATFQKHADEAKTGCPVSKALAATKISLEAKLV